MKQTHTIQEYRPDDGKWYWRIVSRNGHVVADGAQGYKRHADMRRARKRMFQAIRGRTYIVDQS